VLRRNRLSYLALIVVLAAMPPGAAAAARSRRGRRAIRSGLEYVRRQPVQRALLVALGFVAGVALQTNVLMPSLAERDLRAGPVGYGLMLTA